MDRTRIFLIMIFLGALVTVLFVRFGSKPVGSYEAFVETARRVVPVTIADTPALREQGLSGTPYLEPHTGKLFIFPKSDRYSFWMKDMQYPLDIVWVREDGTVVGISANIAPESYPGTVQPVEPVRFVIEINAGESKQDGFVLGQKIKIPQRQQ